MQINIHSLTHSFIFFSSLLFCFPVQPLINQKRWLGLDLGHKFPVYEMSILQTAVEIYCIGQVLLIPGSGNQPYGETWQTWSAHSRWAYYQGICSLPGICTWTLSWLCFPQVFPIWSVQPVLPMIALWNLRGNIFWHFFFSPKLYK